MPFVLESKELLKPGNIPAVMLNIPILAVMPATDIHMAKRAAQLMVERAGIQGFDVLIVLDTAKLGFIQIANSVFAQSLSRYFIYTAQDAFVGRNWLQQAVGCIESKSKGLLAFNDGKWAGMLASFGMAKRSWAVTNYADGLLFNSNYQSHYADTELTLLAMQAGQYCFDPLSLMIEVDWDKDQKATNIHDKTFFALRKKGAFDGKVHHPQLLALFG